MIYEFLESREALECFVAKWEKGTLPKTSWTHAAHIAIGTYYAVCYSDSALEKTREGILRYNMAVGTPNTDTSGYHETLTCFWSAVLAQAASGIEDPFEAVRHTVARFGEDRRYHERFYSFDVVKSTVARRTYIQPENF